MSLKTLTLLVLLVLFWTTRANAEIAYFEGQLTTYYYGPLAPLPPENLPIKYLGSLEWDFATSEAFLEFTFDRAGGSSVFRTGNLIPSHHPVETTQVVATVEQSGSSFTADFHVIRAGFNVGNSVKLEVDTNSEVGTWSYSFRCPVCDFAGLHDAGGTITSFTLVPEPATLPLVGLIAMAGFLGRRFRRNPLTALGT